MKQSKKIIAIIMSIILLISATPVLWASAQPYDDTLEYYQSGMWEYTLEDGEASITGLYPEEELSGTVSVPETLDGYPVTEIDWIYASSEIVIYIPKSIEYLNTSYGLFGGGILGIEIDENNPNYTSIDNVIFTKNMDALIAYPPCGPETYNVPNGITGIGSSAFLWNESIKKVTFPESLEIIGESAFEDCNTLETIVVNNKLSEIYKYAFNGCDKLQSFDFPASLTSIREFVFNNCYSLQGINVDSENPVYSSEDGVLYNKDKTELVRFPEGKSLEDWNFPSSVTTIGHSGFYGCDMESIVIPENIETIGKLAFGSCYFLENVTFAENSSLDTIGELAFSDCNSLKALKLPDGLKSIMHCAFEWSGIEKIYIPQSVQFVDIYAAQRSSLSDVYYAGTRAQWSDILKEDNENFYYYDDYSEFDCAEIHFNTHQTAQGACSSDISWQYDGMGTLTISGSGEMPSYPQGQDAPWNNLDYDIETLIIEEGITEIDGFYKLSNLEKIILPESLKRFESCAFCWNWDDIIKIIYKGMPEQWNDIYFATHDSDACLCYCIENQVIYIDNEDFTIDSITLTADGSTTVKYGETRTIYTDIPATDDYRSLYFLPVGTQLNWYGENDNYFNGYTYYGDEYRFYMTSENSGTSTITVCLEDEDGWTIYNDDGEPIEASIELTSKAGIFEIIAYFFREMFNILFGWLMF